MTPREFRRYQNAPLIVQLWLDWRRADARTRLDWAATTLLVLAMVFGGATALFI